GGDDDVAGHRKLAAAAQRIARDRGDDRRAHPADRFPVRREVLLQHRDRRRRDEGLLDVRAGGEGTLVAGEDDAADRVVVVERGEDRDELTYELSVQY